MPCCSVRELISCRRSPAPPYKRLEQLRTGPGSRLGRKRSPAPPGPSSPQGQPRRVDTHQPERAAAAGTPRVSRQQASPCAVLEKSPPGRSAVDARADSRRPSHRAHVGGSLVAELSTNRSASAYSAGHVAAPLPGTTQPLLAARPHPSSSPRRRPTWSNHREYAPARAPWDPKRQRGWSPSRVLPAPPGAKKKKGAHAAGRSPFDGIWFPTRQATRPPAEIEPVGRVEAGRSTPPRPATASGQAGRYCGPAPAAQPGWRSPPSEQVRAALGRTSRRNSRQALRGVWAGG